MRESDISHSSLPYVQKSCVDYQSDKVFYFSHMLNILEIRN